MLPHNQIPVIPFGRKTLEVRGSSQSMVSGGTGCPFVPFLAMFPLIVCSGGVCHVSIL